jgi:RNA polymerase sigma-70 factor (ECF subfamily)
MVRALAEEHPVAVALNDQAVRSQLTNAALASLGRRAFALSSIQRKAEADAITQEAALRALKLRGRFDASKDVVKWLVGIVFNVVRELVKQRGRAPTGPPPGGPGLEELTVDPTRPVEDVVADQQLVAHLLGQLPEGDRDIVRMKYEEGLTCAEIGERLGLRENAVRVRLHRAHLKLKQVGGATGEGQP